MLNIGISRSVIPKGHPRSGLPKDAESLRVQSDHNEK
jgi:hypothetical protein